MPCASNMLAVSKVQTAASALNLHKIHTILARKTPADAGNIDKGSGALKTLTKEPFEKIVYSGLGLLGISSSSAIRTW